jgi:hypothetical protein
VSGLVTHERSRRPPEPGRRIFTGAQLALELHRGLSSRAKKSGRSLAAEVRRALSIYVELDETAALLIEERGRSAKGGEE